MSDPTIRLRFVTEPGLGAALIRWRSGGLFSHVGAISGDGRFEFGARAGVDGAPSGQPGVQYRPLDYARFTGEAHIEIPCTAFELRRFWRAAERIEGCGYSLAEIVGDALDVAVRVYGRFVCAAAVHWMLTEARMTAPIERDRSRLIVPDWLYGYCSGLARGRRWAVTPFRAA